MKNIILMLIFSLALNKAKAQSFTKYADTANYLIHQIENKKSFPNFKSLRAFKTDTAAFITSILENKAYYKGKPFSILLKDLSIPVKVFTTGTDFKDSNNSPHITLKFYNRFENEKRVENKQDPYNLVVVWAGKVNSNQTNKMALRNQFNWTPEVAEYFGKQIVGDIVKVDYFNPMK